MAAKADAASTSDREIVFVRVVDAPRELVWKAWTDPKHMPNWWGPRGFRTTIEEMDVRPGGVWKFTMHGPDGVDYPNKSIFVEVVPPERLSYKHGGGAKGKPGANFESTVVFEDLRGRTRITMKMLFPTAQAMEEVVKAYGAIEGGMQHLDRMTGFLPTLESKEKPFVLSRRLSAPRERVWKAWTDQGELLRWFGPKGFTMTSARLDFRPGGIFHYGMKGPDGKEMWGKFVYREIVPPERIVLVHSFSDEKGGITRHPMSATWPLEMLSTTTLTEHAGVTTMTIQWQPLGANEAERKTFDSNFDGMTMGWTGTFEQLEAHLAKA